MEGVIVVRISAVLVTVPKLFVSKLQKEMTSREEGGKEVPNEVGVIWMTVVKVPL